jgi:hypothetical protein
LLWRTQSLSKWRDLACCSRLKMEFLTDTWENSLPNISSSLPILQMYNHWLEHVFQVVLFHIGQKFQDARFRTLKSKTMKIHDRIRNIASTVNE